MAYREMRDGLPLYYEDRGNGRPIIFVPGWTITTYFWKHQIAEFERTHRALTLDLRGAGNSGKTQDGHSLSGYAEDLGEFLRQLDLRDVVLVAWAMGVSVAVHYLAATGADRVARFVWVDHSPRFFVAPDWPYALSGNFTPLELDRMVGRLMHERAAMTRPVLASMFHSPLSDDELDTMFAEVMKTPTSTAVTMITAVANVDLRPLLTQIRVPVLLVNGRHSIVPYEVGEWLEAHLPRAKRVVLDGGHAPFWDTVSEFNRVVREFAEAP